MRDKMLNKRWSNVIYNVEILRKPFISSFSGVRC